MSKREEKQEKILRYTEMMTIIYFFLIFTLRKIIIRIILQNYQALIIISIFSKYIIDARDYFSVFNYREKN